MSKYKRGTQAMLDAAKNDATLLPFDTIFIFNKYKLIRTIGMCDGEEHIKMCVVDNDLIWEYYKAEDLLPAKKENKPKQKKWQNGTQEQLDIAKEDARLIPKKTYFMYDAEVVYRIDSPLNNKFSVCMLYVEHNSIMFCNAQNLELIYEE